ncbi:unnamed protein product [Ixodes hexagonus]
MDSARSWAVAASCAWILLFNFAIIRSAAVFYVVILQSFNATREEASWPITITTAMFNIAGSSVAFIILCYTVINAHFDRYKAVASGIGNAGIAVGGLVFPPLAQFLFDKYGTRGGFLLCGAIMMNATAGAFILWISSKSPPERPHGPREAESGDKCLDIPGTDPSAVLENSSPGLKHLHNLFKRLPSKSSEVEHGSLGVRTKSDEMFLQLRDSGLSASLRNSDPVLHAPPSASKIKIYFIGGRWKERKPKGHMELIELQGPARYASHQPAAAWTISGDIAEKASMYKRCSLLLFMAFPRFYLLALSLAVIYLNMVTYVTVIIDLAMDRGIAKWNAIYLVVIYTSADLVARLVSGVITDKRIVSRNTMMAANFLCWGVSLCLVPLFHSYYLQVLLAVTSGWSNGVVYVLSSVVCMDVAGADRFSMCYGMACFLAGLPLLARPSFVGYYRDGMGDYQGLFVVQGLLTLVAAFLWLGLPVREKCKKSATAGIPKAESSEEITSERL